MKKKWNILVALVLSLLLVASLFGCGEKSSSSASKADKTGKAAEKFDPEQAPPNTKQFVVLEGTYQEMGVQYAKQAKDFLQRLIAAKTTTAVNTVGSLDKAYTELDEYKKIYEEKAPELMEMWKGMAEGSGLDLNDILIAFTSFYVEPERNCSTISMWGSQTKKGKLITGTNYDLTIGPYVYEPAVIAFPKDGNSFIAASGLTGTTYLNEKGLMLMCSLGQGAAEGDRAKGLAGKLSSLVIAAKCGTAAEAKDMYMEKLGPASEDNFHAIDTTRDNYVVEHTASKNAVRSSGSFGEKDYLIATNGFMLEEMKDSLYSGDKEWDDWMPRYWTEEKIIQDNSGKNTIDTLNDALGSTSYYVDGEWTYEWDLEHYRGFWSPENKEPGTKCTTRTIALPETLEMYIMVGTRNRDVSDIPNSTGNFCKINLGESLDEMSYNAKTYAQVQIWLGARDMDSAKGNLDERKESLEEAKAALYNGQNYLSMIGSATSREKALGYYGKALSEFGKAQCFGQLAQNDPSKLAREGADYEI